MIIYPHYTSYALFNYQTLICEGKEKKVRIVDWVKTDGERIQ